MISEVNWKFVLSASILAGILSVLTSLAGLPEVDMKNTAHAEEITDGRDPYEQQ